MWRMIIAILVLGLSLCTSVSAQQSGLTYQGRLTENGEPFTGLADLEFSLYDQATSGLLLGGPLLIDEVPVEEGLFQVQLDFGGGTFGADLLFLEIRFNGNTLALRQPVRPAPFALFALDGNPGPPGPVGPTGLAGPVGVAGPAGATGPEGLPGQEGPAGPQGDIGAQGADGPAGPRGPAGIEGPAGPDGPQGPEGYPGSRGLLGMTGAEGPIGETGPRGEIGPAPLEYVQVRDIASSSDNTRNFATDRGRYAWLNNQTVDRSASMEVITENSSEGPFTMIRALEPGYMDVSYHTTWYARDAAPDIDDFIVFVEVRDCSGGGLPTTSVYSSYARSVTTMTLDDRKWYSVSNSEIVYVGSNRCIALAAHELPAEIPDGVIYDPNDGNEVNMIRGTLIVRKLR